MEETEIDIRALLGVLQRRIRLILIILVLVTGAALLVAFSLTPKYTASALLLFNTRAVELLDPAIPVGNSSSDDARVNSEVAILKTDNILLDVIRQNNLVTDAEFGVRLGWRDRIMSLMRIRDASLPTGFDALQSVLGKLRKAVSVRRDGLTYLISVSATSISADSAANIANSVANAYIVAQLRAKVENILIARDLLQSRIEAASSEIVLAERAFDEFIYDNFDGITLETGRTDIGEMRRELDRISTERDSTLAIADLVSQSISLGNWVAVSQSLGDEAFRELQRQREELVSTLAGVVTGSQSEIDLSGALASIDESLLRGAEGGLVSLRQTVAGNQAKISELRQQIRTSVVNSNLPPDTLAQIYRLQQSSDIARTQFQALATRVRELEVQAQTQIADSRVVSAALPPGSPSFPNKKLILAMALMSALGLGVGLAFLYENYLGGFVSEGQMESVLKSRVVATVPHVTLPKIPNRAPGSISAAELMTSAPLSLYSESIRRLRASIDNNLRRQSAAISAEQGQSEQALEKQSEDKQGAVIMLSSAVPGEGKSTMALSLARSYALSCSRVILIDCDLRNPSLHRYLDIQRTSGLAEYLENSENIDLFRQTTVVDEETPLSIIVGSKRSEMPTDHFSAGLALERLISGTRRQFDYVVLDTPPIIPVVDGLYLAEHADVVAMVVRWSSTTQGEAKETMTSLQQVMRPGAEIVTVMNQQENSSRGFRYKYAGYYDA